MERIRPRALRPGAAVGVVAPAGPVNARALAVGLAQLVAWGLRPVPGAALYRSHGYLAGTDAERAADLNDLLADPDLAGIFCARGGYGAMRLLPRLDWAAIRRHPKVFVGFSDITALHLALWQRTRLVTFHGPLLEVHAPETQMPAYNAAGLHRAVFSPDPLGDIPLPEQRENELVTLVPGVARGPLLGGNLELVTRLMGTPWLPDLTGCILLLEDVDEAPYRIDRMLTHLRLGGILDGVAGIVFGYSPSCAEGPPDRPGPGLVEVLADILGGLGKPALYGFPSGHARHRTTLPLGVAAELDATQGRLTVLEPALES